MLEVEALRTISFRFFEGGAPRLASFSLAEGILAKVCDKTRRLTAFRVKARLGMNGEVEVESATETFQRIGSLAPSTKWGGARSRFGGAVDPGAVTPHAEYQYRTGSPSPLRRQMYRSMPPDVQVIRCPNWHSMCTFGLGESRRRHRNGNENKDSVVFRSAT